MRQLSALDASFLYMENSRTYGHVNQLLELDNEQGTEPVTLSQLRQRIAERIHLLPAMRWRLVEVPMNLDHPYWYDQPTIDVERHITEMTLPAPGSDRQLAELVGRLASRPLPRTRPLWEMVLISGWEGGRSAILYKLHHSLIDGASAMEMFDLIFDPTPDGGRQLPPPQPREHEPEPTAATMMMKSWEGIARRGQDAVGLQMQALKVSSALQEQLQKNLQLMTGWMTKPPVQPKKTTLNAVVGPDRRWAFTSVPLDEAKRIKNHYGATVNDVVMTLCAGALRRWLAATGQLGDEPLISIVPMSLRTAQDSGSMGNNVSGLAAELPTNVADPAERMRAARASMLVAKEQVNAESMGLMQDMAGLIPPFAASLAAQMAAGSRAADYSPASANVLISNVRAPAGDHYLGTVPITANYPVSMVGDGMGLNLTVHGYLDRLDFGFIADPDMVPDVWDLMDYLQEAHRELLATVPE